MLPPRLRSTKSICFQKNLYSYTDDVEAQQRNAIEQKLLSSVDNNAARVLQKLYIQDGAVNLTDQERYDFSVFIISLRIRTPEGFKRNVLEAEKILRERLIKNDPRTELHDIGVELAGQTLLEWAEKNHQKLLKNFGAELMANFMIKDKFINRILNMKWFVLKRTASNIDLLTSDRPLVLIGSVESSNVGFALAIAPDRIFIATSQSSSIVSLLRSPHKKIIEHMNISTIQQAESRAFAVDKSHSLRFFERRLAIDHGILPWAISESK